MTKEADFFIVQEPVAIELKCPYCTQDISINWKDIEAPEIWVEDWGEITCPHCKEAIKLNNFEC